jgi:hypothetical protein
LFRRWQTEADLIRHYHALAIGAKPLSAGRTPPGVILREGEQLFWAGDIAVLVGCTDAAGMVRPEHTVYSPSGRGLAYVALDVLRRSRDRGRVLVTDQRVVFTGDRTEREWAFADLTGVLHSLHDGMTIMRVAGRPGDSGLVFDKPTGDLFRFYLSLGIAVARGDRGGFVAHLAQIAAGHQAKRPGPPRRMAARQAPGAEAAAAVRLRRLCFGPPGASTARRVVPVLTTAMIALFGYATLAPGPADERRDGSAAIAAELTPRPTAAAVSPSSDGEPGTEATTGQGASRAPVAVASPVRSSPSPSPKGGTGSYCGAPGNPWGYNFCGGEPITDPDASFCDVFDCVKNFEKGKGYVVQCNDGVFSKSGGRGGSCVQHAGEKRMLYRRE